MEFKNILRINNRQDFREWLESNAETETECFIAVKRGKPKGDTVFYYLDAVEEALCFGWIDSTNKVFDGVRYQRFSPRKNKSLWTELNKERVRRLEKLGLMTDLGRRVLPDMDKPFKVDEDIENAMKRAGAWEQFTSFPPLYQRVRAYNVAFYKGRDEKAYQKALSHLIEETQQGKLFGEWNDYGRLLNYTET